MTEYLNEYEVGPNGELQRKRKPTLSGDRLTNRAINVCLLWSCIASYTYVAFSLGERLASRDCQGTEVRP